MAKARKGSKENPVTLQELDQALAGNDDREYLVTAATIKDDICNYSIRIINGVRKGWTDNLKGAGIVDADMLKAYEKFRVHLAVVDDVYKNSAIEIKNVDKYHKDPLTLLYRVSGFKIVGDEGNESIILIGDKKLSSGGWMGLETPKIPLDNASSYKWHEALKAAADVARNEVAEYHEGKFEPIEEEEIKPDLKQTKITFGASTEAGNEQTNSIDDFKDAEV